MTGKHTLKEFGGGFLITFIIFGLLGVGDLTVKNCDIIHQDILGKHIIYSGGFFSAMDYLKDTVEKQELKGVVGENVASYGYECTYDITTETISDNINYLWRKIS